MRRQGLCVLTAFPCSADIHHLELCSTWMCQRHVSQLPLETLSSAPRPYIHAKKSFASHKFTWDIIKFIKSVYNFRDIRLIFSMLKQPKTLLNSNVLILDLSFSHIYKLRENILIVSYYKLLWEFFLFSYFYYGCHVVLSNFCEVIPIETQRTYKKSIHAIVPY